MNEKHKITVGHLYEVTTEWISYDNKEPFNLNIIPKNSVIFVIEVTVSDVWDDMIILSVLFNNKIHIWNRVRPYNISQMRKLL